MTAKEYSLNHASGCNRSLPVIASGSAAKRSIGWLLVRLFCGVHTEIAGVRKVGKIVGELRMRAATPADVVSIASVHVASWREAYTGIMPDSFLAEQSIETRISMWTEVFRNRELFNCSEIFVVQDAGRIIAFGSCGPQRDHTLADGGFDGEVGGLYVLQSHQKRGVGRLLMAAMFEVLSSLGHTGASLWVLRDNQPGRDFYKCLGGKIVGKKRDKRFNGALAEVAYGWSDLSRLAQ